MDIEDIDRSSEAWLHGALGLPAGDTPFPWQRELLRRFSKGHVDRHLDIPTGLGKTSVMAIWLVALALGAPLPRRLIYIVDRRAVVDQSTEEALRLSKFVEENKDLKAALGLRSRLRISTIRGQHVDNQKWLEDPTAPAIVVGTVDMIGSRILFQGYGVSRRMRPYQAGLLGADVLVALDEAHLAVPLERLLDAIVAGDIDSRPESLGQLIPPIRFMTLTATGGVDKGSPFGLTEDDFRHRVVGRRLRAEKRLRLEPLSDPKQLGVKLAELAWRLADDGESCVRMIVFCDNPKDAEDAKAATEKHAKGDKSQRVRTSIDARLFTGGQRVYERETLAGWLKDFGFVPRQMDEPAPVLDRPAFVFATSAAEVGVDLDADHMVCDLVAWDRMVQRLGRVNRRGEGSADVVVVYNDNPPPGAMTKEPDDRTKAEARKVAQYQRNAAHLNAMESLPQVNGVFDASPESIRRIRQRASTDETLKQTLDDASTQPPLRPALSRALVDAWSMTSLREHTGRPAVRPWLRGWDDDPPQTAVVWRKYLPTRNAANRPAKIEVERFFEAASPHLSEKLETYTSEVVDWLEVRAEALLCTPNGDDEDDDRLKPNDVAAVVVNRAGDVQETSDGLGLTLEDVCLSRIADKSAKKVAKAELEHILGHATLVVDARLAGLRDGRLSPQSKDRVHTADDGDDWLCSVDGISVTRFRVRQTSDTSEDVGAREWRSHSRFATRLSDDGNETQWLVVDRWAGDASTEEGRSSGPPQLLHEHHRWAETAARTIATNLDLPPDYREALATAARLHDEGKRARRWQRAFNAPPNGTYAKTRGPIHFRLLDGYRHEFGSLAHAEEDPSITQMPGELRDLVLHLIASHHGFARPVIRTDGCDDWSPAMLACRARQVAMRFVRLQKRWGPWGLAWWESLLRAADIQASRENDYRHRDRQDGSAAVERETA